MLSRDELKRLSEAIERVGEGIKGIEGRFQKVDQTMTIFASVKRHQLWWALAIAFMAGALALPFIQLLIEWVRGVLH